MSATTELRGRPRRRGNVTPSTCRCANLPLTVWPCAQRSAQCQRRGRFVPESNRHPAKMLPELARRAISAYSDPGDVVLDPMCGIGTTVVEASHLDRPRNRRRARGSLGRARGAKREARARPRSQGASARDAGRRAPARRRAARRVRRDGRARAELASLRRRPSRGLEGRRWHGAMPRVRRPARNCQGSRDGRAAQAHPPLRRQCRQRREPALRQHRRSTHRRGWGELPLGDGGDLPGLRTDAQARRVPRARHEEHALAGQPCGTSLATRPPYAKGLASCISSTSLRFSRPSAMTGCSRDPPISS